MTDLRKYSNAKMGEKKENEIVSIILLNWNCKEYLVSCLNSLINQSYKNIEIILVDNNSSDDSVEFISRSFTQVRIIKNPYNYGYAKGNNIGAKQSKGNWLFFLNPDTVLETNTIEELINKIKKGENIGILACYMKYPNGTDMHKGIGVDLLGYPIVKGKIFYTEGSALFISKDLFYELGKFDEEYFMFHEDIDLCWRCWLVEKKVDVVEKAIVYHYHGAKAGGRVVNGIYSSSVFRREMAERNNIRTILKNYQCITLLFILPFYLLMNIAEMILFLFTLQFKVFFCYPKAYWWNICHFKSTLYERKKIQKSRRIGDLVILKKMYWGSAKFSLFWQLARKGLPKFI